MNKPLDSDLKREVSRGGGISMYHGRGCGWVAYFEVVRYLGYVIYEMWTSDFKTKCHMQEENSFLDLRISTRMVASLLLGGRRNVVGKRMIPTLT